MNQLLSKVTPEVVSAIIGVILGYTLEAVSRFLSERAANRRTLHRAFNEIGDNHIFCRVVSESGLEQKVRHLELNAVNGLLENEQYFSLPEELQKNLRNFRGWAVTFNAEIDVLQSIRANPNDLHGENNYINRLKKACADFEPELKGILVNMRKELRREYWFKIFLQEQVKPVLLWRLPFGAKDVEKQ